MVGSSSQEHFPSSNEVRCSTVKAFQRSFGHSLQLWLAFPNRNAGKIEHRIHPDASRQSTSYNQPSAGTTHVLYNWWLVPDYLKYDQVVHAYGFGLVTWICWQGLQRSFAGEGVEKKPTIGLLTICVAAGMGFGAANEIVEFIATLLLPGTNVGGYENTGWDLVANFVGCLIAATMIYMMSRRARGKT